VGHRINITAALASSIAGLLCVTLFALAAFAQEPSCKVQDPELQGSYQGGCRDGWAEGYGVARGSAQYRGAFKAGRKHGKGVKTWATGDRYEGDFVEDRREGTGMYVWGSGSEWRGQRYTGGYANDRRHGYGVYEWPNGEHIAGPWENDRYFGTPSVGLVKRNRAHAELAAVIGVPGAKVCRQMEIGVATREMVRGTVTAAARDRISIRIDEPGTLGHVIGDVHLRKGAVVTDRMKNWLPCV
jgi:hypothetical protein